MVEGEGVSTRVWLDPPGPLRFYRWLVGSLILLSVVATAVFGLALPGRTALFLGGMAAIGILGVSYLVIWAVDLVVLYTDPNGSAWH